MAASSRAGEFSAYFGGLQAVRERPNWTVASIALHREVEFAPPV